MLPAEIARRFRGSVLFVPALLHRLGEAVIEGIGGCNLGSRNLDFHYRGFARLGAIVDEARDEIHIKAGRLQGAHLYLDTPSHTGTENLIMAASLAPGTTVIDNTALEPEVLGRDRVPDQDGRARSAAAAPASSPSTASASWPPSSTP